LTDLLGLALKAVRAESLRWVKESRPRSEGRDKWEFLHKKEQVIHEFL
jgi:hypothetical protein